MAAQLTSSQRRWEGGLRSSRVIDEEAEGKLHYWSVREGDDVRMQEHELESAPPNNKVIYFKVMDGGTCKIMPRAIGARESSVFLKAKRKMSTQMYRSPEAEAKSGHNAHGWGQSSHGQARFSPESPHSPRKRR